MTRGRDPQNPFAPGAGYIYAGLFAVTSHWLEDGRDGFVIARFRLDRLEGQPALVTSSPPEPDAAFASTTVSRRIRDSAVARSVKALYDDECQICQLTIRGASGRRYSEGAHVRPLGRPHLGPDAPSNLLCLCPNHHTQLDTGGLFIDSSLAVVSMNDEFATTPLRFRGSHTLDVDNADYHRRMWIGTVVSPPGS